MYIYVYRCISIYFNLHTYTLTCIRTCIRTYIHPYIDIHGFRNPKPLRPGACTIGALNG